MRESIRLIKNGYKLGVLITHFRTNYTHFELLKLNISTLKSIDLKRTLVDPVEFPR